MPITFHNPSDNQILSSSTKTSLTPRTVYIPNNSDHSISPTKTYTSSTNLLSSQLTPPAQTQHQPTNQPAHQPSKTHTTTSQKPLPTKSTKSSTIPNPLSHHQTIHSITNSHHIPPFRSQHWTPRRRDKRKRHRIPIYSQVRQVPTDKSNWDSKVHFCRRVGHNSMYRCLRVECLVVFYHGDLGGYG